MNLKHRAVESPIEFPLRLSSDLRVVRLADDVRIRRMDDAARLRLLGIEGLEFDAEGRLKSYKSRGDDPWSSDIGLALDQFDQLCSSNYVATLPSHKDALDLNFALKLAGGMAIIAAKDEPEAHAIQKQDPLVTAGLADYELAPFWPDVDLG